MFTLSFQLKQTAAVKISLCNLYGSTLECIMEEPLQAGHHQIEKKLSAYSPGVYFLRLQAGEEVVVQKVIRY
ncbi:MAG: T9SS type A sorting domain-containing protein [Lentimicrobium sp.]|nr:T9SS type A sorting domain-containing protein [Lentimicrobium sp.]